MPFKESNCALNSRQWAVSAAIVAISICTCEKINDNTNVLGVSVHERCLRAQLYLECDFDK